VTQINITAQGRVLTVQLELALPERPHGQAGGGVPRGTIRGLSPQSRMRLLKKLYRIHWDEKHNKFITLTYPADYPEPGQAKTHLDTWFKRLRRKFPRTSVLWVLEFQKRGAPHFHGLSPNMPFFPRSELQVMWGEIIGYKDVYVWIESFPESDAMRYMAKYASKSLRKPEEESGEICDSIKTKEEPETEWTGRLWGEKNKRFMPYSRLYTKTTDQIEVYHKLYDKSTKLWPGLKDVSQGSFTLFVDDAAEFADLT